MQYSFPEACPIFGCAQSDEEIRFPCDAPVTVERTLIPHSSPNHTPTHHKDGSAIRLAKT